MVENFAGHIYIALHNPAGGAAEDGPGDIAVFHGGVACDDAAGVADADQTALPLPAQRIDQRPRCDSGAAGTAGYSGPTEKDLTLAAVKATQKRLESLGATVVVPRTDDSTMTMDARIQQAEAKKVDFFISMHYNSIATGANATNAKGVEVYYYQDMSTDFGQHMLASLSTGTGRNARGVKFSTFRVTLNTYAPSLLLELGFLCNPVEYDNICNPQNLYQTANAVAEGIIATLK